MPDEQPKKTITRAEYLQLLGLKTLADQHNRAMKEIIAAAEQVTGERDAERAGSYIAGHCADMCWDERQGLEETLNRLGIRVEGPGDV